jgi:hypothetical protein
VKDATTDTSLICRWWNQWEESNVGLATGSKSGLVVLDVDGETGRNALRERRVHLPPTVCVLTGKERGLHYYFALPPNQTIPNRANILPSVDLRGEGGYVVAPPSLHASGRRYEWAEKLSPDEVGLALCPRWLLELAGQTSKTAGGCNIRSPVNTARILAGVPEGERDEALFRLACKLRQVDLPEEFAAKMILEAATNCKPPFPVDEALKKVRQAYSYPISNGNHSAAPRVTVPAEIGLRFTTAADVVESVPAEVPWIVRPWAVSGAITELDGKPKSAGKTTFLTHMIACVLTGRDFLGQPTQATPVVYLTEQHPPSFREALRRAGLLGRGDLILLHHSETVMLPWDRVMSQVIAECQRRGARMLVVDTITPFAGLQGDVENHAGAALAAVAPLQTAAAQSLAVVMVRHERKSGGAVGESGRGSSAFAGAVDIVLSLRRPEGNLRPQVREIHALSRFDETPDRLFIELTSQGYIALGSESKVALEEAKRALMEALPIAAENALKLEDLLKTPGNDKLKRTIAQEAIEILLGEGRASRAGGGKRGNPFRFWREGNLSAGTSSPGAK